MKIHLETTLYLIFFPTFQLLYGHSTLQGMSNEVSRRRAAVINRAIHNRANGLGMKPLSASGGFKDR